MKARKQGVFLTLKGAVIGTGAILPGISGGVLCVALGVYRPMMELLSHPIVMLKKQWSFYLPLLLGFAVGVLGLSRAVDWLFRASPVPAVWLFIGLIAGTLPSLWREAGVEGRPASAWIAGGAAFALTCAALYVISHGTVRQVQPTVWTWLLCGVLWGIGLIAPGLSPSSLFIFMGVYQPMAAGIANLDASILLPMGLGLLACVLTLTHAVNALLHRAYAQTMHAILGVALASTLAILPFGNAANWRDVALYALCFGLGLVLALWMEAVNRRMTAAGQKQS